MNINTKKFGDKVLEMSFDRNTIKHLGISMYSSMPPAIAELIANAYDADAEEVIITIDNKLKKITVKDNGIGMSFDKINDHFLKIGRNRRDDESVRTDKGRHVTGKKGLGKLALFGLAQEIQIETTEKKSKEKTMFILNWEDIIGENSSATGEPYKPDSFPMEKENLYEQGTKVELRKIKRKTAIHIDELAKKISWLFNFDLDDFKVKIIDESDGREISIDRTNRYKVIEEIGLQKKWTIPKDYKIDLKDEINGEIYACIKPIAARYKGISLYANGRMVNAPSFFDIPESGHFFSYISGWLEVNFIDDESDDLISTNRQSLNWDSEYIMGIGLREKIQGLLRRLRGEWENIRKKDKQKRVESDIGFSVKQWKDSLSPEYRVAISKIINILYKGEQEETDYKEIIRITHGEIMPDFPEYNLWFGLHKNIMNDEGTAELFKGGHYYDAVDQAIKVYMEKLQDLSGVNEDGNNLIEKVFKYKNISPIEITNKKTETEQNIERANQNHALGVHFGFRNPKAHHSTGKIKKKGIISKNDCLRILVIISHLYSNLDKRKKPKQITGKS